MYLRSRKKTTQALGGRAGGVLDRRDMAVFQGLVERGKKRSELQRGEKKLSREGQDQQKRRPVPNRNTTALLQEGEKTFAPVGREGKERKGRTRGGKGRPRKGGQTEREHGGE